MGKQKDKDEASWPIGIVKNSCLTIAEVMMEEIEE
jgi:hypothetical protein